MFVSCDDIYLFTYYLFRTLYRLSPPNTECRDVILADSLEIIWKGTCHSACFKVQFRHLFAITELNQDKSQ